MRERCVCANVVCVCVSARARLLVYGLRNEWTHSKIIKVRLSNRVVSGLWLGYGRVCVCVHVCMIEECVKSE